MDSAQICVLEKTHHECFASLLKCKYRLRLESKIALVVRGNLSHESLEGQFSNEQLCALLELSDFSESHSTWPKSMRLLDCAHGTHIALINGGCRCCLPCSLVGYVLSGRFGTCVFSCGLLCSSHFIKVMCVSE